MSDLVGKPRLTRFCCNPAHNWPSRFVLSSASHLNPGQTKTTRSIPLELFSAVRQNLTVSHGQLSWENCSFTNTRSIPWSYFRQSDKCVMSWENCSLHTQKNQWSWPGCSLIVFFFFFFFCLVLQPIHLNLKFQVLNSHKLVCVWTGLIPKSFLTSKPNVILVSIHVKALGERDNWFTGVLFQGQFFWPNVT